jgi:ABC-type sugar transport system ATPase subunit
MEHGLSLTEIYKSFGEVNALRGVSFEWRKVKLLLYWVPRVR